ncbi:MAG: enoyl-CoA hydratase/isomerase family protein [Acidimicrobiia bacterium]
MSGLDISFENQVARVTIDRGPKNLLDAEGCERLTQLLLDPPAGCRIMRLGAAGPTFCLGRERVAEEPDDLRAEVRRLIDLNQALVGGALVVVSEVQGDAAGFGAGLVALSDIAVSAPEARFWFPEVEIDLAAVVVLTWLPRIVGRRTAFELTATGRRLTAQEARELGLVNEVAADSGALGQTVDRVVERLLSLSGRVHLEIKDYLRATQDLDENRAYEEALDRLVVGSMGRRRDADDRRE